MRSGAAGMAPRAASCRGVEEGHVAGARGGPRPRRWRGTRAGSGATRRPDSTRREGGDVGLGPWRRRAGVGRLDVRRGGGHGHARPGRSRTAGPRTRGGSRIRLARSAGGPHGHLEARAGRLALADDAQDDGLSAPGCDRAGRSGRCGIGSAGRRGRRCDRRDGAPPGRPACRRTTSRIRALARDRRRVGLESPRASPSARSRRRSRPRPRPRQDPMPMPMPMEAEAGAEEAAREPRSGPRRRASSRGGPPGRPDRRGHGSGAGRRSTARRGSGWRSRSRCPARRRPRPPASRRRCSAVRVRQAFDAPGSRRPARAGRLPGIASPPRIRPSQSPRTSTTAAPLSPG